MGDKRRKRYASRTEFYEWKKLQLFFDENDQIIPKNGFKDNQFAYFSQFPQSGGHIFRTRIFQDMWVFLDVWHY
jgi:hypothetical protein